MWAPLVAVQTSNRYSNSCHTQPRTCAQVCLFLIEIVYFICKLLLRYVLPSNTGYTCSACSTGSPIYSLANRLEICLPTFYVEFVRIKWGLYLCQFFWWFTMIVVFKEYQSVTVIVDVTFIDMYFSFKLLPVLNSELKENHLTGFTYLILLLLVNQLSWLYKSC
jgi:hypothetical protein